LLALIALHIYGNHHKKENAMTLHEARRIANLLLEANTTRAAAERATAKAYSTIGATDQESRMAVALACEKEAEILKCLLDATLAMDVGGDEPSK
jgi:hypothetical protein